MDVFSPLNSNAYADGTSDASTETDHGGSWQRVPVRGATIPRAGALQAGVGVKKTHSWEFFPRQMAELDDPRWRPDLREQLEEVRRAVTAVIDEPTLRPGDLPSCEETRELLGLYARLPSEDVRRAVIGLLRVIVGSPA